MDIAYQKDSELVSGCLDRRRAGVLLHVTSLPGSGANGDLGPEAMHFIDFLVSAGISVWQTLPIGPTHGDGSPYQTSSAHAGNPLLISLHTPVERGWLHGLLNIPGGKKQTNLSAQGLVPAWVFFLERVQKLSLVL